MKLKLIKVLILLSVFYFPFTAIAGLYDKTTVFKNGSKVSDVKVLIESQYLDGSTKQVVDELDAASKLQQAIISKLNKKKRFDSQGNLKLDILVKNITLKEQGSKLMFGAMAGSDLLEVNVLVLNNDVPYIEFESKVTGNRGSKEDSLETMIESISWRIYKMLVGEGQPKDVTPKREALASAPEGSAPVIEKNNEELLPSTPKVNPDNKAPSKETTFSGVETQPHPSKSTGISSTKDKLIELKSLYEQELISKDEYAAAREKVLDAM